MLTPPALATPSSYSLEPEQAYKVVSPIGHPEVVRWQPPAHLGRLRPALVLLAGEVLELPALTVGPDTRLRLQFSAALPTISADGLELEVVAGDGQCVLRTHLACSEPTPREAEVSLGWLPGETRLRLRCLPGPAGDPSADWLALLELTVGAAHELDLLAARTFAALRAQHESAHFAHAYGHPMYLARRQRTRRGIDALIPSERSFEIAGAVENAFDHAHALLSTRISRKAPDFQLRLQQLSASLVGRPLRVVSICSGMGLTEAALFHSITHAVELTLVDANESLLALARELMPAHVKVTPIVGDANALKLPANAFDLAICVSGVHHLVELGALFGGLRDALLPGGELWLIGEQIGPKGNRLDPAELAVANRIFSQLDPTLRLNIGSDSIDTVLRNPDCSEATFEGILSHRIEDELSKCFATVHASRRNCFLWRLVGPEYVQNYRLDDSTHLQIIDLLVATEVQHWRRGGRPTELHGVYSPLR